MTSVLTRELKSYYGGMTGFVFAALLLLFAGIYTMAINLTAGYTTFEYVLSNMSFIYLIITPILTMRIISEERRQKTDMLLYSLPLGMTRVVLGKYIAALAVLAAPCAVMCAYPLILSAYGPVNLASAYSSILGFFMLGAALTAIGMFVSSLTENQVVAAAACFGVVLLLYFISSLAAYCPDTSVASFWACFIVLLLLAAIVWLLTRSGFVAALTAVVCEGGITALFVLRPETFSGLFPKVMEELSVFERFYVFVDGMFDLTALIYFLTVIAVFVFLTVQSVEKRRWS